MTAVRNYEGADAAEAAGVVVGAELDLADLASVKSFPTRLEAALLTEAAKMAKTAATDSSGGGRSGSSGTHVDVLLNNAGVMAVRDVRGNA